jgi:hypothetical protein
MEVWQFVTNVQGMHPRYRLLGKYPLAINRTRQVACVWLFTYPQISVIKPQALLCQ